MELLMCIIFSVTAAIVCLCSWAKLCSWNRYRFPPGPKGLPVLGCPWYFFREIHVLLTQLSNVWGDCIYVNILGEQMVVFSNPDTVRLLFGKCLGASGRPAFPTYNNYVGHFTFSMQPNKQWSEQRKVYHKILTKYGKELQTPDDLSHDEISQATQWLERHKEDRINLNDVIFPYFNNILMVLLTGRRYNYDSSVLKNIQMLDQSWIRCFSPESRLLFSVFPFLRHVNIGPGKDAVRHFKCAEQFMNDAYEETKATYNPDVTRGMIDCLLHYQNETRQTDGETWLEEKFVKGMVMETILAGSGPTKAFLYTFFLAMLHKPEVAKLIQEEIKAVTGGNRLVRIQDRPNMNYTVAAILELFRYTSHVPLGAAHMTTEDVRVGDYFLPKGTTMLNNAWLYHHDKALWTEPWEYKPERFLGEDKKLLPPEHPNHKNLHPFGVGKRSCVGEVFVRPHIFLFVATLLQRFDFLPDSTRAIPSCDPRTFTCGDILQSKEYFVRIKSRD